MQQYYMNGRKHCVKTNMISSSPPPNYVAILTIKWTSAGVLNYDRSLCYRHRTFNNHIQIMLTLKSYNLQGKEYNHLLEIINDL